MTLARKITGVCMIAIGTITGFATVIQAESIFVGRATIIDAGIICAAYLCTASMVAIGVSVSKRQAGL